VQLLFATAAGVMPQIKAGKIRAVTVLGSKRIEALPDMPTVVEAGFPEFALSGWYGVVVPAATPRDTVTRLNAAIVKAINSPDLSKRLRTAGQQPSASSPEEFRDQIRNDYERWGQIVKLTGAKVD